MTDDTLIIAIAEGHRRLKQPIMKYRFRMIVRLGIFKVTPYVTNVDEGKKQSLIETSETLDALLGGSLLRYLKLEFEPI